MLRARRVPVWLIATDGFWAGRRLIDLVMLHRIRGVTAVVGRFVPPDDDQQHRLRHSHCRNSDSEPGEHS
jgi:hypothetical protein